MLNFFYGGGGVYIELFILDNLIMNALMLRIAAAFCSVRLPVWRMALWSAAGAVYAVFALYCPLLMTLPFKLVSGALMASALPTKCIKGYALGTAALYIAAFITGGMVTALAYMTGALENGGATASIPLAVALTGALIATFLPRLARELVRRQSGYKGELVILSGGREYRMHAIVDTGSSLREPVSGLPVTVVYRRELIPLASIPVPVTTLTGSAVLYAFAPDSAELYCGKRLALYSLIAVSNSPIAGGAALIPLAALSA